jgi:WD40 repeat protein
MENGTCIRTFDEKVDSVYSITFSPDGKFALSGSEDGTLKLWRLDWKYEFPGWTDWDDGAEPYLRNFLTLRERQWSEDDFNYLINDLQNRGYGWLRPEGVRKKLDEMKNT